MATDYDYLFKLLLCVHLSALPSCPAPLARAFDAARGPLSCWEPYASTCGRQRSLLLQLHSARGKASRGSLFALLTRGCTQDRRLWRRQVLPAAPLRGAHCWGKKSRARKRRGPPFTLRAHTADLCRTTRTRRATSPPLASILCVHPARRLWQGLRRGPGSRAAVAGQAEPLCMPCCCEGGRHGAPALRSRGPSNGPSL
jgi:hypothetical protein